MMRRWAIIAIACVLGALGSPVARADDFDTCRLAAEASQHLHAEGKLGAEHRELLVCATDRCPEVMQIDCRAWLTVNERAQPTVVLSTRDTAGRDLQARLRVDGAPVVADGRALPLDPGRHAITADADGYRPAAVDVVLSEGEKNRPVVLSLGQIPPPVLTRPIPTRVFVLGGVAAAALIGAATLGALAWNEFDEDQRRCGSLCTSTEKGPLWRYDIATDVTLGVGVVLLALAVWQYLGRPTHRVAPFVAARGIGLSF